MPASDHPVVVCLSEHLSAVGSIRAAYPLLGRAVMPLDDEAARVYAEVLDQAQKHEAPAIEPRHPMPVWKTTEYLLPSRAYENAKGALTLLPRSLVVAMVSQHDAFIGGLIRALFTLQPQLLDAIERPVTFADLRDLRDVNAVREKLVEDEIRGVLRESHLRQLSWLASRLSIRLDSDQHLLDRFNEVAQRRHLYAHTGGIITSQYLAARYKIDPEFAGSVGEPLDLTPEDFETAYQVLVEIAVKLSQVTWRRVRPDQLGQAEDTLSMVGYILLVFEEHALAQRILEFARDMPRHQREQTRRKDLINLAQAYKWQGDEERCRQVLRDDWSACEDSFSLALAVLSDDYDVARRLMLTVGRSGDVPRQAFLDWPLFRKFRETPQFADAFHELFGAPGGGERAA